MMTLSLALLSVGCFFLWRRQSHWVWITVVVALAIGIAIFVQDVDFHTDLGVQL